MSSNDNRFRDVIGNDEHLAVFLRTMRRFDAYFCELMMEKKDFTLRMEVRADKGKVIHCRVHNDMFDHPSDSPKKREY